MDTTELAPQDRARRMYGRLLVLDRVFQRIGDQRQEPEADGSKRAFREGVRDMLAELAEDARIVATAPCASDGWRPREEPLDEQWRSISQLERREVRRLVRAYENLIEYCEALPSPPATADGSCLDINWHRITVGRFKSEAAFLLTEADER